MNILNKNIFLNGHVCHTRGWYLNKKTETKEPSYAEQFRINEGIEIGKRARAGYPDGILVNTGNDIQNEVLTKKLLQDPNINTIFEATFIHNHLIAKADILVRSGKQWHLIEVKSASASNEIKTEYIEDLAYTAYVIAKCGINLGKSSLKLISKFYRIWMDEEYLFTEIDCTEQIANHLHEYAITENEIVNAIINHEKPNPTLIYPCKHCEFYTSICVGKGIKNSLFDLPRLSKKQFMSLKHMNANQIEAIPDELHLSSLQNKVRTAIQRKAPIMDLTKLKNELNQITYPVFYLDFETVSTAIPLYENTAPYEEIITQFSIHKYTAPKQLESHEKYLANPARDDRENLTFKLIRDLEQEGSIIVYHAGAEKKYLANLARFFPELAPALQAIIARIVDIKEILKNTYYHPDFHGSYSIKKVLPVLVPSMSYKNLAIRDGQTASATFAALARGTIAEKEVATVKQQLLEYCKQDTLAMVKIHEKLISMSKVHSESTDFA